jgi:hypothetical protein
MLETQLHFVSAIVVLLAAIVSIYLTIRLNGNLRKLSAILTIFILTHSIYHILEFSGSTQVAEDIFEPLSVAVLIFFGIVYTNIASPKKSSTTIPLAAWNPSVLSVLVDNITPILLIVALGIFIRLAIISKSVRTFQFQISVFIIIWILGEIAGILQNSGILNLSSLQSDIGLEIHVISMVFLSMMLWLRYYYSRSAEKMI